MSSTSVALVIFITQDHRDVVTAEKRQGTPGAVGLVQPQADRTNCEDLLAQGRHVSWAEEPMNVTVVGKKWHPFRGGDSSCPWPPRW